MLGKQSHNTAMNCLHTIFTATAYYFLLKEPILLTTKIQRLYKNMLTEEAKWESKLCLNAKLTRTHYSEVYFYLHCDLN